MDARSRVPAVSCVLIFLNAARYIDEAIVSVVGQVGWDDWELLLVDDGSTDESTDIARRWAARDPRIRYLDHPGHENKGMSAARNLGVAEARGEYVSFLDSDDVWLPMMLAQRMRQLDDHPEAHAIIGPTWNWHSWTGEVSDRALDVVFPLPPIVPLRQVVRPPALFVAVYGRPGYEYAPGVCGLVMRRDTFIGIGGSIDSFRALFEDQVMFARAFLHVPIVLDDRPLALYRQHSASACARAIDSGEYDPNNANPALDRFVNWLSSYVDERFGRDGPEWRAFVAGRARDEKELVRMSQSRWRVAALQARRRWAWRGRRCVGAISRVVRRPRRRAFVDVWAEQFVTAWSGRVHGRVLLATSRRRPRWLSFDPDEVTTVVGPLSGGADDPGYDWVVVLHDAAKGPTNELLDACSARLAAGGSVLALVESHTAATRAEIVAQARLRFPAMVVRAEPFGSGAVADLGRQGITAERAGAAVDHHDPDAHLLVGLSITTR